MENGKNLLGGVLAGAVAGYLAGVLLAPDKGSVTRGNLSRKGRDSVSGLRQKMTGVMDKVADRFAATEGRNSSSEGPSRKATAERSRPANSGYESPEAL